jgi:hypothetical protein
MDREEWKNLLSLDYRNRGRRKPVYHSESKIELTDCYDAEELVKTGFDPERASFTPLARIVESISIACFFRFIPMSMPMI